MEALHKLLVGEHHTRLSTWNRQKLALAQAKGYAQTTTSTFPLTPGSLPYHLPSSSVSQNLPPVRIGDLEMNMNPSTHLPFDTDLEQTWRLESADARVHHQRRYKILLSPLHPMASFLSEGT
ncbi:hypothetical protein BKA70DRAFT_1437145 [Coprinopsis sp. MPI-PUGE-AT-0042]|nr:hypothetical protein BKA70DRAFT_1437145 [Coprinopsis sp. MPI-PUGE-AT-0042]